MAGTYVSSTFQNVFPFQFGEARYTQFCITVHLWQFHTPAGFQTALRDKDVTATHINLCGILMSSEDDGIITAAKIQKSSML